MNAELLKSVIEEIAPLLENRRVGKIFQVSAHSLAFDFRPHTGNYLFISVEPSQTPRIYLIERRLKDLEKQAEVPSNFLQFIRKRLSHADLQKIIKDENDRIVHFKFRGYDEESDAFQHFTLVAQFTGRSANVFFLDAEEKILDSLRESQVEGRQIGEIYRKIEFDAETRRNIGAENTEFLGLQAETGNKSLSQILDLHFQQIEAEREFSQLAKVTENYLSQEVKQREKLFLKLQTDLAKHGNAEDHKRHGDLLLANIGTAQRTGNFVKVIDYFDENLAELTLEADENSSLPEIAEKFFKRYGKAKRADKELSGRIIALENEIAELKEKKIKLAEISGRKDLTELNSFVESNQISGLSKLKKTEKQAGAKKKNEPEKVSGMRQYLSADGYEILVGRNSKDNDFLTMRVAKSLDWWFHAADYGGSHVVVRNKTKGELPPKTLLEAAQLAAKFSQAKDTPKVAVHYTQRKFVNKPKGAKSGLVRLASFRTILIEPKEAGTRIFGD